MIQRELSKKSGGLSVRVLTPFGKRTDHKRRSVKPSLLLPIYDEG